ncbi:MAG TPA: zf-HC2 domain-containing protein [Solirubrobacteraceae bacterium]|nr:zf-HC2 domain-containing protein [Solirubrobacteraceae bacterium]
MRFRRDHGWAPTQMSEYLDGQLPDGRRVRLERHTVECPECERLLAELSAVVQGLGRLSGPPSGDATRIAVAVRARLDEPRS